MGTNTAGLGVEGLGIWRLAALLIKYRLRTLRNGVRARGRGRVPVVAVVVGVVMAASYVMLFVQAFGVICATTDLAGQVTALAVVALIISFGSFSAKAASSEAVLAGSGENEFLLARPVALPSLVVARCLAESATDPLGALFLMPVLLAATVTWKLPAGAVVLAAVVSMLVQLGIAGAAQATQIALVRFVPRARRRAAWMVLGLIASLSLASLWMMMTRVLRSPASVASGLAPLGPLVARTPGALIAGPLAGLARGSVGGALVALGALAAATSAVVALAAFVARRAGMAGWEEAGASWSDASARPQVGPRRVLTAATKDLALITRDRTRLLTLVSMPVIFVGVQLFGTAGWEWSTATLARVSHVAFSLTLYMVTIGPLAHMQAERRAFWIMRAVPVSVGRLLAAKAKAWSVVIGGVALLAFGVLSLGTPALTVGAWLGGALVVVVGAVGVTWLSIALAAGAADLSDETRPAIGPVTIYTFMLVGGLYNVVLNADAATLALGAVLYVFAIAAYWYEGVRHATVCLDAEAVRERRVSLGAGAAFVVVLALGRRGIAAGVEAAGVAPALGTLIANVGVAAVLALAAGLYLAGRPAATKRGSIAGAAMVALPLGVAAGAGMRLLGFPPAEGIQALLQQPLAAALVVPVLLGEELALRGVLQRGLEEALAGRRAAAMASTLGLSALGSVVLAVVAGGETGVPAVGVLLIVHAAAAVTRALSGRWSAALLARVVAVAAALALARGGF
jgi:hypothetical protein